MNILELIPLADILGASHLIGLSLAIGGVIVADTIALKSLLKQSSNLEHTFPLLETLHYGIAIGLLTLLISGLGILFDRFETLQAIPGKVWVKLGLVMLLTANAVIIQKKNHTLAGNYTRISPVISKYFKPAQP